MAAELGGRPGVQRESITSFRLFKQGLDRRRPSQRQTTLRSFKIVTNWSDGPSQATTSSSQESFSNNKRTGGLSTVHEDTRVVSSSPAATSTLHITHGTVVSPRGSPVPLATTSPKSVLTNSLQPSSVPHSRATSEESPNLVASESAQRCRSKQSSRESVVLNERTPSQLLEKPLSEKTPHSGPGALKTTKGRKRRLKEVDVDVEGSNEIEAVEDDYRGNNFVRFFNADQGRKRNMGDITDLDVILTAVEEEALKVRGQIESTTGKQAVKEFFIQMRQSFCETIDISKENQMLKLDLRKAKSKVTKLRKEVLSVQQKRSSIAAQLIKEKGRCEADSERQKTLEDFSSFLKQLETLHKECRETSSEKPSKLEAGLSCSNLPSLLIGGHSLFSAASQLKSINDLLQD